jgi:hypothetical protein
LKTMINPSRPGTPNSISSRASREAASAGETPPSRASSPPPTPVPEAAPVPGGSRRTITPKWDEAYRYQYDGQMPNMQSHPKGWNGDMSAENLPPSLWPVTRHEGQETGSSQSSLMSPRPEAPLFHYLDNYGEHAVQNKLSFQPIKVRPPTKGEADVVGDFEAGIKEAISRGTDPRKGEFIASYLEKADPETGRVSIQRASFDFFVGSSSRASIHPIEPDYIIHSHPFDPANPHGYSVRHPLGGAYPSITDYLTSKRMGEGALALGDRPAKVMLVHGPDAYVIHSRDFNFTKLEAPQPPVNTISTLRFIPYSS